MTSPADRSSRIARQQADAKARRIRADLANRASDPDLHANLAATYERQGYGTDGYPLDYPDADKQLD